MEGRISPPEHLFIAPSVITGAGRGVFTNAPIPKGTLIERCPVVALADEKDRARLRKTGLVQYYFLWGEKRDHAAICLGWGSVYNHSYTPNAEYSKLLEGDFMDFVALRDIRAGEEITVNYNGDAQNTNASNVPGIPSPEGKPFSVKPRIKRYLALFKRLISHTHAISVAHFAPVLYL